VAALRAQCISTLVKACVSRALLNGALEQLRHMCCQLFLSDLLSSLFCFYRLEVFSITQPSLYITGPGFCDAPTSSLSTNGTYKCTASEKAALDNDVERDRVRCVQSTQPTHAPPSALVSHSRTSLCLGISLTHLTLSRYLIHAPHSVSLSHSRTSLYLVI